MSLKEPIVEGAYYEREDGVIATAKRGPLVSTCTVAGHVVYRDKGTSFAIGGPSLTRRVYLVPTDPTEVVAELWGRRARAALIAEDNNNDPFRLGRESAWRDAAEYVERALGREIAADLVAEKLGVE